MMAHSAQVRFTRLHAGSALRNRHGFTLLELLVVVAIIGILTAITLPRFAMFRQNAFDTRAEFDLRNAVTAEEVYYSTHEAYVSCTDTTCGDGTTLPGFQKSGGVIIAMTKDDALPQFTGTATHSDGTGKVWSYDSGAGGIRS
jgi:prepilin-type N-terminal cleavage/methylation domain-containing protein